MKSHRNLYKKIISFENLILAWKKARKGKTKKDYVIEFEKNLFHNLLALHYELKYQSYQPASLKEFPIKDPKTRKIAKSEFRDRIVHHAINNILEPIFEPLLISDLCSNRKGKGTHYALQRFQQFIRKVSRNGKQKGWLTANQVKGYCLKGDIKHYFQEINHAVLLEMLRKRIRDERTMDLIKKILTNIARERERERETPFELPREYLSAT